MTPTWIELMRERSAFDVARALGKSEVGRTPSAYCLACPACNAERRHTRSSDRRGAVSIQKSKPQGWYCHQCKVGGDALNFVAYLLRGARFRDLSDHSKADVREWCCELLGIEANSSSYSRGARSTKASASMLDAADPAAAPRSIPTPIALPPTPAEPPAQPPPIDDLRKLWLECAARADEVPSVARWLRGTRNANATAIADLVIAKALRPNVPLPAFAHIQRKSGPPIAMSRTSYLYATLLYSARGVARNVIFRSVDPSMRIKSRSCGARAGLVMACPIAKRMLRHGSHPSQWPAVPDAEVPFDEQRLWPAEQPLELVIAEGEVDFALWASEQHDATEYPHAVIGIVQGSWTAEIATRVPDGTRVLLAPDLDKDGEKYSENIIETLRGRDVELRRWKPRVAA